MAIPPVVALEIGTSKILAMVGELREDAHVMVTGMGEYPASGVRKGEVIDIENAAICVRSVLQAAEESSQVTIRQVHLAISGGHIESMVNRGTVPVLDKDGEIREEDIEQVAAVSRAVHLPTDREVLHTIFQYFCIDDQERVIRPEGMEGGKLSLDTLVLHGVRTRLHNTMRVVQKIPLDVQDVAFSGLCSALAVLTPEQKKSGVAVIDLGGGTTDYLAYAGSVVAAAGVLGVGGDHVTNDITLAFSIPISQAERLKREAGSAIWDDADPRQRVALPPEGGFPGRSVSLKALHTVIHARVDEMLRMVRKRLEHEGILRQLGAGVVLTGGGAHLRRIAELATRVFGVPAVIGRPRNVTGLATVTEGPEYATCTGLVQYGFRTVAGPKKGPTWGSWIGKLFGR